MKDNLNMNALMEDFYSAFRSNGFSSREKLNKEWGLKKVLWGAYFLRRAALHTPDPVPIDDLGRRWSYYPGDFFRSNMLDPLVELGFLSPDFTATEKAHTFFTQYHAAFNEELKDLETLPEADMLQLLGFISKANTYIANLQQPPHPEFDLYARRAVDPHEHRVKQVYDAMGPIYSYRDDSHVAAWGATGLQGPELDVLTFLWDRGSSPLDSLARELAPDKGQTREAYAVALATLAEKGWAHENDGAGSWQLTEGGQKVRDDIEAQTDRNFELLFDAFDSDDQQAFVRLFTALNQALDKEAS